MATPQVSSKAKKSDVKAQHHLASGGVSGFTSAVALQPLDLLKTRLQQGYEGSASKRRRISPVLKEVLREDGIIGLWRGTLPTVVRNVPGVALYFYSLSAIRDNLSQLPYFAIPTGPAFSSTSPSSRSSGTTLVRMSSSGNLLAGAIARTSVGLIFNPITVLKARYESNRFSEYRSMNGAFSSLLRTHGIKGLFQGFTATAVRDAPYAGISLVAYEKGKDVAARVIQPEWGVPNAVLHSGSAAIASMLATLATSPADCVKTRMQVNSGDHPTIRLTIRRIYSDRGLRGFFSGSTLRIVRKAASGAIAWTTYEGILLFLRDRHLLSGA